MRLALFTFVVSLLPAQDMSQSARTGQRALNDGAYTTAVYFLKQAVTAEPRHPSAWEALGRAYLALDQVDNAIDACRKQIEVRLDDSAVYGTLGSALWRKGQRDEAIAAFRKQIEEDPRDASGHASLGHLYCELGRYAEAVPELETAVTMNPENAVAQADIGDAYLGLGRTDKGFAILDRLAQDHPIAIVLNSVSRALASHRVQLQVAQQYAEWAVASAAKQLQMFGDNRAPVLTLRAEAELATYWDTLGWVHFQAGNLDEADKFITAAWSANPSGPIGDHLGRLYERHGQKEQAILSYSRALAAPDALPETRRRMEALTGAGGADWKEDRAVGVFPAGKLLPDKAAADFYVAQVQRPAVAEARFIRGDERLLPFTKIVQDLTPAGVFPEATPPKLVRRVTLSCPGNGGECTIELFSAAAAVFAELNSIPPNAFATAPLTGKPGIYRAGGSVTAPVPTYRPEPEYTKEASKKKIQGTIVLYMEVDPTGHARNIKVMRGLGYGLDEKAIEAVGKWEFHPGMKDGKPGTVAATVEVHFRLLNDH